MRVQPNMTVIVPADAEEARKAILATAATPYPTYIRFTREKSPVMTTEATSFEIGKAIVCYEGENSEVTVIACGPLLYNALQAAHELAGEGVSVTVINNHTVKPLDIETIVSSVQKTKAVVTVEEHQIAGGMGSAIAEALAARLPVPFEFIGVHDSFGQSGTPDELIEHYGMGVFAIKEAIKKVITRKLPSV